MNTKSICLGLGGSARVRAGLAAAGLLIAAFNLSAESALTTHIPFAFMACGTSMPAGDYRVEAVSPGVVLLAGAGLSERVLMIASSASSGTSVPGITFDRTGAVPQLSVIQSARGTWQFATPGGSGSAIAAVALRPRKSKSAAEKTEPDKPRFATGLDEDLNQRTAYLASHGLLVHVGRRGHIFESQAQGYKYGDSRPGPTSASRP